MPFVWTLTNCPGTASEAMDGASKTIFQTAGIKASCERIVACSTNFFTYTILSLMDEDAVPLSQSSQIEGRLDGRHVLRMGRVGLAREERP